MRRNQKYYGRGYEINPDELELTYLRKSCYNLVDKILRYGDIRKVELFEALSIRLRIPVSNCYINRFDLETCKKAYKELERML